jgi:hypothetical protein
MEHYGRRMEAIRRKWRNRGDITCKLERMEKNIQKRIDKRWQKNI